METVMIGRRTLLGLAPAALVSCARSEGAYFGSTVAPKTRRLVHTLGGEIETLDPAKSTTSHESWVIPALFEGLTQYHPELPTPMAALATHYEANSDFTQFRFYLRGHPAPRGVRLPSSADLPPTYLRGRRPSPDFVRAYWSDGSPITAYDFVYSWRRFVNPQTAAWFAFQLIILRNAQEVLSGKRPPAELGVHAPDEFTFVVDLRSSTPFFLELITSYLYSPVPMQAVEAARKRNADSTWTKPSHIVTSGAFTLREYRPYERIVLVRNPRYYDASLVSLDELIFLPVVDGTTVMNLYKAGDAMLTPGLGLPPIFAPVLSHKKDFHSAAAFGTMFPCISTRRLPFDNVLLRYALNMATEKKALTDFLGPGYQPARSLIAPLPGYTRPDSLDIDVDGRSYNVLSFDVEGARCLLAKAGFPGGLGHGGNRLEVPYHLPILPDSRKAEIVQQQWLHYLNIRVKLVPREFNVHWRMVLKADYSGIADYAVFPLYLDPNGFLDQFPSDSSGNPSGWSDSGYVSELATANAILSRTERLKRLATCEKRLLEAMPFLPFFHSAFAFLCKPFVRGIASHLFDVRAFKYVWIDTHWRPE
jgi:ABC-type oligopeptide transport system substrate-binding subunit